MNELYAFLLSVGFVTTLLVVVQWMDTKAKLTRIRHGQRTWVPRSKQQRQIVQLVADAELLLRRYHSDRRHSRTAMANEGMSARRWNRAWSFLKECGVEHKNQYQCAEELHRRATAMWKSSPHVDVLPH